MKDKQTFNVVITDHAWPDLSMETDAFSPLNIGLIATHCKTETDIIRIAEQADAIIAVHSPITQKVIDSLQKCKIIAVSAAGYNTIDVKSVTDAGIILTNCSDYCQDEVADHTMAMVLSCARGVFLFDRRIKEGIWDYQSAGKLCRLKNSTLGLVGFGSIAQAVALRAKSFNLNIVAADPFAPDESFQTSGVIKTDLKELLATSDYISIHTPLTESTKNIISKRELQLMKTSAYLINTSYGGVIDEKALYDALSNGTIRGAAIDVLKKEPPDNNNPLLGLDNILITPHTAFYSEDSLKDVRIRTSQAIVDVHNGVLPKDIVNKEVLKKGKLRMVESKNNFCMKNEIFNSRQKSAIQKKKTDSFIQDVI